MNFKDCESNIWSSVFPPPKTCQHNLSRLFSAARGLFNKSKNGAGTGLAPRAHIFVKHSWTRVQSVQQNQVPLKTSYDDNKVTKGYIKDLIICILFRKERITKTKYKKKAPLFWMSPDSPNNQHGMLSHTANKIKRITKSNMSEILWI